MRIALLQIGCRSCRSGDNVDNAARWVEEAYRTYNPDLIVLPEFFNTCYFPQYNDVPRYWTLAEPLDGRAVTALREQARDLSTCIAAGIYERGSTGIHFDTAVFVESDGSLTGVYRKVHAPAVPGGYEKLYYVPGTQYSVFDTSMGWKVGLLICYDWRFPEAARSLAIGGADLILMPFATPPMRLWSEALRTRAWENQAVRGYLQSSGPGWQLGVRGCKSRCGSLGRCGSRRGCKRRNRCGGSRYRGDRSCARYRFQLARSPPGHLSRSCAGCGCLTGEE